MKYSFRKGDDQIKSKSNDNYLLSVHHIYYGQKSNCHKACAFDLNSGQPHFCHQHLDII